MEPDTNNFGVRLRALIDRRGLTLVDFAEEYGLTESQLHNWLKRPQPPLAKHWPRLSKFFGVSETYISSGVPEKSEPVSGATVEAPGKYNGRITPVTEKFREIAVVSWAHAGDAGGYDQIAEHEQEKILTASTDPKAFAVTIEGESMLPDYKPGDRVIVAPSRTPRNGRPVVVKLADDGILIRLFHRVNARTIRLTSLNPDVYPPTDLREGQYRWCWPVEEQIRRHC